MLNRVRERCTGAQARAAGATCLIDVTFPQPGPASG
jgi:hypothetical protein